MYIGVSPSYSLSFLRASRARFAPAISRVSLSSSSSSSSGIAASGSCSSSSFSTISGGYRSLGFLPAFRSPRWSHGVDWRSPVSLRAQIRAAAPVIERFERKMATIGTLNCFRLWYFLFALCGRVGDGKENFEVVLCWFYCRKAFWIYYWAVNVVALIWRYVLVRCFEKLNFWSWWMVELSE